MQYIKRPQKASNHLNQDEDEDESRSQNDGDHEFSGINIQMLTDDKRLHVQIPSYDAHYRIYFENPEAFNSCNRYLGKCQNLLMRPRYTRNGRKLSSRLVVLTFPASLTQMPWI